MSVVKIFQPRNPLASDIVDATAPTIDALVRDAERRVETLKPSIRAYVSEMRANVAKLAAQSEEMLFADCKEIGAAALNICDVAGAAGQEATGEAARGIHAMVDALVNGGVWHTDALRLHLDALRLLNTDPPPPKAEADRILADLKAMRDWVGVAE